MNLVELLLRHAEDAPDEPALRGNDETVTYEQLARAVRRVAGAVRARGVEVGDRVLISGTNDPGFVRAYLGVLAAGGVAVPVNPHDAAREREREIESIEPKLAFDELTPEELAAATPIEVEPRDDTDLAVLLFTAGTAGAPKAAMLTHGNLAANIRQVLDCDALALGPDDVSIAILPFFHVFGLNVVLGVALAAGATLEIAPHVDPASTLAFLRDRRVTVLAGVPAMYAAWLALDDATAPRDAFASVQLAVSGADALPVEVARAIQDRFGLVVHEGYGLTEAAPIVTSAAITPDAGAGTIGVPLPGVEVRLVDVDHEHVLVGDPGEIWVRGPNVFPGYWRDAASTERVLTADGWLKTGDVAVADDHGVLRLVDRIKDLIIVSGFNVYPAEVEEVLREHADVADAAVIGVPDTRTGATIAAYVTAAPKRSPRPEALMQWSSERLARYKRPSTIEVVDELPRSFAGKVLRRELRAQEPDVTRNPT